MASGEREPYPASHRAARRLRARRGGDRLRRRERRGSAALRLASRRRKLGPPPCARNHDARLGQGFGRRDPHGRRRRTAHRRSRRARAGRDDAGAGLRARRRPCRADRRHDHRGRAMGEDRDARARRLRSLLAHHPRLPQDRLRPLAAMARRARTRRPGDPDRAPDRRRNQGARGRSAPRSDHHRRLDRRQSRHRPPDRGDRARSSGRGRAARPRP